MAIANITNNILTDSGVATSSLQIALNGTGFVKASGTTISYDNSTYYLASNPSAYIALTALSFAAGSGAYNSTTGVITIPTNNNQITNGAGYITSAALSGYLPLTGGTLTGALNINLSSGTALNVAGNAIFRGDTGVGTPRQLIITSGGGTPVYLEAKGYGANYQTDFGIKTFNNVGTAFEVFYADSSGRVGINQTSPSYQLDVNGTGRFTGNLFTNYIGASGDIEVLNGKILYLYNTGSSTYWWQRNNANTYELNFGASLTPLSIASTGAATFSSSVTATEGKFSFDGGTEPTYVTGTAGKFIRSGSGIYGGVKVALVGGSAGGDNGFDFYNASTLVGQFGYGAGGQQFYFTKGVNMATTSGNVLIGTTTDNGYKLYVDGGSSNGMAFYSTSPANQFKIAGSAAAMTFSNTISAPSMGGSLGVATSAGDFLSGTAAGDTIFINQFSGKRLYAVSYSGGVYLSSGATSWTANSDIRLKNINSHIENAVEKLSTLQTINFSYKDDKTNKQNLGLIAQEVEKIFPELIDKNGDGMLGVRYTELVPVLIKAIQEQQKEINELKLKIK